MSITLRKLIKAISTLASGTAVLCKTKFVKPSTHQEVLGYKLHDDVSVTLLKDYARSLALKDKDARWQAQMMFHKCQIAREGGGTQSHVLGYKHEAFLNWKETGVLTEDDKFHLNW